MFLSWEPACARQSARTRSGCGDTTTTDCGGLGSRRRDFWSARCDRQQRGGEIGDADVWSCGSRRAGVGGNERHQCARSHELTRSRRRQATRWILALVPLIRHLLRRLIHWRALRSCHCHPAHAGHCSHVRFRAHRARICVAGQRKVGQHQAQHESYGTGGATDGSHCLNDTAPRGRCQGRRPRCC